MTEPPTGNSTGKGARWRARATVAVLSAATLVAVGYMAIEYRKSSDESATASVTGVEPSIGGTSTELTPLPSGSVSGSAVPSVSPSGSSRAESASASKKPTGKATAKKPGPGGFPGAGNTGPGGTSLASFSGSCTVSKSGTVITGKLIKCDPLAIRATNVTISKSKIIGSIDTTEEKPYSFTLVDSEVDGGVNQRPTLGLTNITVRRSEIYGGQANVLCYANCDIRDSWLHSPGLASGADWHLNGVLTNAVGNVTLIHNTIDCDTPANSAGGGCSGDVSVFADFGPVSNVTVRNNLMGASKDISYCVYGGNSSKSFTSGVKNIVFTDNVFRRGSNRKCGAFGPVTSFDSGASGNVWKNNVWEDGATIPASN